jgi:hypothetical protein
VISHRPKAQTPVAFCVLGLPSHTAPPGCDNHNASKYCHVSPWAKLALSDVLIVLFRCRTGWVEAVGSQDARRPEGTVRPVC